MAFTYNNVKEKRTVNDFTMLKEAVAVDDTTVEFHMEKPYSIWPYTMAIVGIVPEHAYDESYGQHPIGSGRYIMKQWDKGQQVIFEANPDYYGEQPKMKKVTVLFMEEEAALAAAQAGQVDVAHTAASYSDLSLDGYSLFSEMCIRDSINSVQISVFHTVFNITNTLILFPFAGKLVKLSEKLLPEKPEEKADPIQDVKQRLAEYRSDTPAFALEAATHEVLAMGAVCLDNVQTAIRCV